MNCRAKTLNVALLRLAVLIVFSALLSPANALESQSASYSVIDTSPKLSVYPEWMFSRIMAIRGWSPSLSATDECKLSFSSPELQPARCEANYHLSHWQSVLSKLFVEFDLSDVRKFHRIQFEPQAGLKIRGLLGLQTLNGRIQKKPMIIIRMGIYGNVDEVLAERLFARLSYQDLGYHILLIESLTSHGYLTLNKKYSLGGVEEGLHTFYILNLITHKKVDWAKNISDVYLMGQSLAGPGVFVANYLDEHSTIKGKKKAADIKAIELFCPLINLKETYHEHSKPGFFSAMSDIWTRTRLVSLRLSDKKLENIPWWKTIFDLKPRFAPEVLSDLNLKQGQPVFNLENFNDFKDLQLPKEFVDHVSKSKTLFELNEFWSFYKNEQTPIHIYVTPNDPFVMNKLNSELIREHKQPGIFNKVQFTDLKGMHCALAAEYQWPFLVELVRRGFKNEN